MGDIALFFQSVMTIFNISVTLYGYTFTFFQLFLAGALITVVGVFLGKLLDM